MDYFVKEAHSDGDEKNLFRMDHSAMIRTGTLTRPDGKKETISLVFPDAGSEKTELLPNQEFGEWIRDREKAKQGQLVYFNTSCWSHAKAVHEIEAAHSPTLLDIPSLTMMQTFADDPTSAERLMFDGFRKGMNYEAMRAELSKNELNKTGKETSCSFLMTRATAITSPIYSPPQWTPKSRSLGTASPIISTRFSIKNNAESSETKSKT